MAKRSSRHADLPTYTRRGPAGCEGEAVEIELYRPREGQRKPKARLHEVEAGERLDLIAHAHFGDPHQFWRLVDANPVEEPEALLEPGRTLVVPEGD